MESKSSFESALEQLIQLSSEKGFLVFEDIYDIADIWYLSIRDIDYLSSAITTRGILVYDETPVTNTVACVDENYDDYAQSDYDSVFSRVLEIDPELEDFINYVRAIIPPQAREMDQLKYQVQEGNLFARERVIQMHLRFAVRIALQRTETYGCEISDTLQDACVGLIMAVDKYSPDLNGSFGSYASLWMLQNISRVQGTQRPTIYYPVHKKEDYYTMFPILKEQGYIDYDDIWINQEVRKLIQDRMGCNLNQAEDIINQSMPVESLDDVYGVLLENLEGDEMYENGIQTVKAEVFYSCEDINSIIEQISLKQTCEQLLGKLSSREQTVLRARYGFDDGIAKTLEEVGQMLGVTRERIRQIEAKAMNKIAQTTIGKNLKDFLYE